MKRYFYFDELVDEGQVKGPVTAQKLRELLFANEITDACKVCAEDSVNADGVGNWSSLQGTLSINSAQYVAKHERKNPKNVKLSLWRRYGNWYDRMLVNNTFQFWGHLVGWPLILLLCWFGYLKPHIDQKKADKQARAESIERHRESLAAAGISSYTYRSGNIWANRDIVSIEEIKTDASLNPIIGFGPGRNGRVRPMVGALPRAGKIQWKVTWRDSSGVLRSQVVDKYPSRY